MFCDPRRNATGGFAKIIPRAPWWRFWQTPRLLEDDLKHFANIHFG